MLRPQPFDLRQWHVALQRVPALLVGSPADSAKTGTAGLYSLCTALCRLLLV